MNIFALTLRRTSCDLTSVASMPSNREASLCRLMVEYSLSNAFKFGRCLRSYTRPAKQRHCSRYASCTCAAALTLFLVQVLYGSLFARIAAKNIEMIWMTLHRLRTVLHWQTLSGWGVEVSCAVRYWLSLDCIWKVCIAIQSGQYMAGLFETHLVCIDRRSIQSWGSWCDEFGAAICKELFIGSLTSTHHFLQLVTMPAGRAYFDGRPSLCCCWFSFVHVARENKSLFLPA